MPKRYRITMTIVGEANAPIDQSVHDEEYDDDDEAKRRFQQKADAAKNAGKGMGKGAP